MTTRIIARYSTLKGCGAGCHLTSMVTMLCGKPLLNRDSSNRYLPSRRKRLRRSMVKRWPQPKALCTVEYLGQLPRVFTFAVEGAPHSSKRIRERKDVARYKQVL